MFIGFFQMVIGKKGETRVRDMGRSRWIRVTDLLFVMSMFLLIGGCASGTTSLEPVSPGEDGDGQETLAQEPISNETSDENILQPNPFSTTPLLPNPTGYDLRERKQEKAHRSIECESDVRFCMDTCLTGGVASVVTGNLTPILSYSSIRSQCESYCRDEHDCPSSLDSMDAPGVGRYKPSTGKRE